MRISDWSSDVCSSDLRYLGVDMPDYSRIPEFGPNIGIPKGARDMSDFQRDFARIGQKPGKRKSLIRKFGSLSKTPRSEERRVGNECVSKCSSRWSPSHSNKNIASHSTYEHNIY